MCVPEICLNFINLLLEVVSLYKHLATCKHSLNSLILFTLVYIAMATFSPTLKHKINLIRIFLYAAKMYWIDFLKPIIFKIERDSIKRNNFISIILFKVPPKHNENV